jgi:hypothetical protein
MRPLMQGQNTAYDGYLYAGISQEQGTQIRFDARDDRTQRKLMLSSFQITSLPVSCTCPKAAASTCMACLSNQYRR